MLINPYDRVLTFFSPLFLFQNLYQERNVLLSTMLINPYDRVITPFSHFSFPYSFPRSFFSFKIETLSLLIKTTHNKLS